MSTRVARGLGTGERTYLVGVKSDAIRANVAKDLGRVGSLIDWPTLLVQHLDHFESSRILETVSLATNDCTQSATVLILRG